MNKTIELLEKLIAIPSVKDEPAENAPFGKGPADALALTLSLCDELGFETHNVDNYAGYATFGPADEKLAILCHVDVVPAGEGWETDPFTATIKDGRLYGRGAVDDKGPAAAAMSALAEICEEGIPLARGVRLIFGTDEESGWKDMVYYKAHCPEPEMLITPDSSFPLVNAEKGVLQTLFIGSFADPGDILAFDGGTRVNIVPNKAVCRVRLCESAINEAIAAFDCPATFTVEAEGDECRIICDGLAAHGSMPEEGVNAVAYLAALLCRLPLKGALADYLAAMCDCIFDYTGAAAGIACTEEETGPLTINWGTLNYKDGEATAAVDFRYPIASTSEWILGTLRERLAPAKIRIDVTDDKPGHLVPLDSELVQTLLATYEQVFGKKGVALSSGGATYARAFKNGVAFGPLEPEYENTEHGPNEYIPIDALMDLQKALKLAIINICGK